MPGLLELITVLSALSLVLALTADEGVSPLDDAALASLGWL